MDKGLINKVISSLEIAIEDLYQENTKQGMSKIAEQVPNIALIVSEIESQEQQEVLLKILGEILPAMEDNDSTLVADLINYELMEFLKSL